MPRLSLWRPEKTNDFKYLDNIIREQYTVGGLDMQYACSQISRAKTNCGTIG